MSLQLSKNKPRQLQYAAGGLREDYTLLELDENLLDTIIRDQVVIKGDPDEEAVLCTGNKTFALKVVETTNTLLLLPQQEDLDGDFAAIPSLSPGPDTVLREIGLQTQLQKNAVSKQYPPLTATATARSHVELVEIAPRLDLLPQLLGKPYSLEDEDDTTAAAAAASDDDDDVMDADGPGAASSSRRCASNNTDQLLQGVQASRSELLSELRRLHAVELCGVWRLVDEAYLGQLLEMIIACAMEQDWDVGNIPLQQTIEAVQATGYIPAIIKHCLEVYGTPCQQQHMAAAAADPRSSSSSHYALDGQAVCLHYARNLLAEKEVWYRDAFLAAWHQVVPSCWQPREDMLLGEAVFMNLEIHEGYSEPRLRYLPARHLPSAPGPRFAALFAVQPKWTREQLDPYLAELKVPGQTVDMLLLKYARASQRSPVDSTVVFVAR